VSGSSGAARGLAELSSGRHFLGPTNGLEIATAKRPVGKHPVGEPWKSTPFACALRAPARTGCTQGGSIELLGSPESYFE